jgi:hypothetical protein
VSNVCFNNKRDAATRKELTDMKEKQEETRPEVQKEKSWAQQGVK